MKRIILATLVAVLLSLLPFAANAAEQESAQDKFFQALRVVECGDVESPPDGDGGKAIGPYQIWKAYFDDAKKADSSLAPLQYSDCRMEEIGRLVVSSYLRHYAPKSWAKQNWKNLARVHNGGPGGCRVKATLPYWAKVQRAMQSLEK